MTRNNRNHEVINCCLGILKQCSFIIIMLGFLGCTGSVHPLLTEKNLLEDSDLSGKWFLEIPDNDGNFQKLPVELDGYDTSTYDLHIPEEWIKSQKKTKTKGLEFPGEWNFQIGMIDNQLYGQIIPQDIPSGPPVAFGIPVYWFGKVTLSDNIIEFTPVSDDKGLVAKQESLPHRKYEPGKFVEMTVFTMSTADLQDAVRKHGDALFRSKAFVLRKRDAAQ